MKKSDLIIVRGAGDLATGTIHRLKKSGFHLLVLETDHPAAIRRQVALSEAVYSGSTCVENVEAVRIESVEQMRTGLVLAMAVYAPIVLYRGIGLMRWWPVETTTLLLAATEWLMLAAALWLWWQGRAG